MQFASFAEFLWVAGVVLGVMGLLFASVLVARRVGGARSCIWLEYPKNVIADNSRRRVNPVFLMTVGIFAAAACLLVFYYAVAAPRTFEGSTMYKAAIEKNGDEQWQSVSWLSKDIWNGNDDKVRTYELDVDTADGNSVKVASSPLVVPKENCIICQVDDEKEESVYIIEKAKKRIYSDGSAVVLSANPQGKYAGTLADDLDVYVYAHADTLEKAMVGNDELTDGKSVFLPDVDRFSDVNTGQTVLF